MRLIVIGCGRVGSELAYRLFQRGHKVVVVDNNAGAFTNLPPDFRGRLVEGDPLSLDILSRAGIKEANGIALVTNSDSINAVIAQIARSEFGISNVVVRNYDPNSRTLYDTFNVQVVSSSSWGAQRIEELLYHVDIRSVHAAGNGEVEVYEFSIPDGWDGKTLKQVVPSGECQPISLTRAGRAMLATDVTIMARGDILLVGATLEGVEELRQCLLMSQED
jgi:trk system potassium uptake protein